MRSRTSSVVAVGLILGFSLALSVSTPGAQELSVVLVECPDADDLSPDQWRNVLLPPNCQIIDNVDPISQSDGDDGLDAAAQGGGAASTFGQVYTAVTTARDAVVELIGSTMPGGAQRR